MKQLIVFFLPAFFIAQVAHAQNVGIGTTTPADKLSVQTTTQSFGVTHTDGTITVGTFVGGNYGWLGTKSNHSLAFFTNSGAAQMVLSTNGNVGIGTGTPVNQLQLGDIGGYAGNAIAYGNSGQATGLSQTGSASIFGSTTHIALMPGNGVGYVGINTTTPANNLQIGSAGGYSGNAIAYGASGQATGLSQTGSASIFGSTTQMALMPSNGAGFVGINTAAPANKLQIGSVGATGYAGNDIAFGNGTQATAIAQTSALSQWYSTSDIALMPQANGHGRVGINTTAPQFPLDVEDYVQTGEALDGYAYFKTDVSGANLQASTGFCHPCIANVSIYASNNVYGLEFDAYSDVRIKDIHDVTNTNQDLETLNAIQITDYTLKDKVKNGEKPFKKVIAQQVETVYPQIVSRHMDFIPNVYQAASKLVKTDAGYLLYFDSAHHISKEAKKLKVLASGDNVMNKYEIVSIPSDNQVIIKAGNLNGDKVFVYGEEVPDFRTVDYEGLTTLNISATQELSKLITQQHATIQEQNEKIAALTEKIATLMEDMKSLKQKN
jgi:hypothetical protein